MLLRRLEELHGAPVVHRLLAGAPAPWPCPGGEDHRVAALHGFSDATFDPLFLEVNQHGLCAVGFDVGHLLLLADQPPHLVPVLGEHPYQPPRRLAVRPRYENLHSRSPYSPSQRLPSLSRCETGTGTLLYLVHARNDAASGAAAPQPRTVVRPLPERHAAGASGMERPRGTGAAGDGGGCSTGCAPSSA